MFVRAKKSGAYEYLQVVENERIDGRVRQRVVATLGRMDVLQATGRIDALLSSCARFAEKVSVLDAHRRGQLPPAETIKIGPPLVFGRLWRQLGIQEVLDRLLAGRPAGATQAGGQVAGGQQRLPQVPEGSARPGAFCDRRGEDPAGGAIRRPLGPPERPGTSSD